MWLVRLLLIVLVMAMLPLIVRVVTGIFAALLGRQVGPAGPRTRYRCPRCHDSGWIATGEVTKRACGCGAIPPEARGPVIDVGPEDRRQDRR